MNAGTFADYNKIRDKLNIPHRHTYYHILLFTAGHGTFKIDFEKFDVRPGLIYFMIPGQVHCWDLSEDKDGYVINFSENVFRSFILNPDYLRQFPFLRGIPKDSALDLKGDSLNEAIHFFKLIINEVKKKDKFSMEQVCFHLMALFISITRHECIMVNKQIPEQKQNILYNFRMLVNKHYKEKRLPKDYAAMLHITPHQLNTICNDQTATSPGEIIRERIILEAKRLLVNVDLSVTEIAYQLNFTDNSYFSKFFKKYTLVNPEEFRRMHAA